MNRNKLILAGVAVAVMLVGLYFASPYWAVRQMTAAAKEGQADKLASYVDFPAVRESVKAQFQASVLNSMKQTGKDNPFASLGMALAGTMVNGMVDSMITAEGLAAMMRNAKVKDARERAQPPASPSGSNSAREPDAPAEPGLQPTISHHYEGLDFFHVDIKEPEKSDPALTWVLRRDGMFSWKLVSVRMHKLSEL